jgi:hypothetical protein
VFPELPPDCRHGNTVRLLNQSESGAAFGPFTGEVTGVSTLH